jgi:hypothetical protein
MSSEVEASGNVRRDRAFASFAVVFGSRNVAVPVISGRERSRFGHSAPASIDATLNVTEPLRSLVKAAIRSVKRIAEISDFDGKTLASHALRRGSRRRRDQPQRVALGSAPPRWLEN